MIEDEENFVDSDSARKNIKIIVENVLSAMDNIGYVNHKDKISIYDSLKGNLLKKYKEGKLSLDKFIAISNKAKKYATEDVEEMDKIGYLNVRRKAELLLEKFNKNLNLMIGESLR